MGQVNLPKGRDLASEYSKTLSAQIGLMPELLGSQAQFQPLQTRTQLSGLDQLLFGTPGGSYQTESYRPAIFTNQDGKLSYGRVPRGYAGIIDTPPLPRLQDLQQAQRTGMATSPYFASGYNSDLSAPSTETGLGITGSTTGDAALIGGAVGGPLGALAGASTGSFIETGNPDPISAALGINFWGGGDQKRRIAREQFTTTTNTYDPQRGLLSIYGEAAPILGDITRGEATRTRASDIADVGTLGASALEAVRQSNPQAAQLLDALTGQANAEVSAGTRLTAPQSGQLLDSVRSAQAARGMGLGLSDALQEAVAEQQLGQQVQESRRNFAGNVIGLNQLLYGDPFQRVLGRAGAGLGDTQGTVGQALGLGGQGGFLNFLNPESNYAQDLYNTNFNAQASKGFADAAALNQLIAAGISSIGNLAGGAMAMCWVAREVFGPDPRWVLFRKWMFTRAPRWFFKLYAENGERFAAWIADKPRIKRIIRRWMETKIKEV